MIVVLLITIFLIGCVLLFFGLRGKLVDNHPLCRRCKYDLVGTTELPTNCPECGTELKKPRATRIGNRKRRRAVLAVGLVIFASALTISSFLGWAQAKNFDWYPYKPLWMLSNEAMTTVLPRQTKKAQQEILRRLTDDELSNKQIHRLIEKSLTIQSDLTVTWDYFWGDLIEEAWVIQKLEDDQLERYLKTAASTGMILVARSKVRKGDYMPVQRGFGRGARAGKSRQFKIYRNYGPMRIDETEIDTSSGSGSGILGGGSGWSARPRKFDAPLGKHVLNMDFHFRVVPSKAIDSKVFHAMEKEDRERLISTHKILDWVDTASVPIEVIAPDEPVIELIDDPTLKEAILKAITVQQVQLKQARKARLKQARKFESRCWIEFDALPMPVGFEVFWRVDDQEWSVLKITALETRDSLDSHFPHRSIEGFPIDTTHVDIILRSSAEVAEHRVGLNRIWQGEIVILNQPLKYEEED